VIRASPDAAPDQAQAQRRKALAPVCGHETDPKTEAAIADYFATAPESSGLDATAGEHERLNDQVYTCRTGKRRPKA